jgi:hypothetical protein
MCPGCGMTHAIRISGPGAWQWNSNVDSPTLSPSVLFQSGHFAQGRRSDRCWCDWKREHPEEATSFSCLRCHSFVTDGKIQFLSDSTHPLAGQTVDLPEYEG